MAQSADKRIVTEKALADLRGVANGIANINSAGQVVDATGAVVAGGGLSQDDLANALSDALSNYVTTVALNALLVHIPYFDAYNGTAWPSVRPVEAGTRQLIATGGAVGPTYLNSTYKDFWIGSV